MSCEDQDRKNMSLKEMLEHRELHYQNSRAAFASGDITKGNMEALQSRVMFFAWAREACIQARDPMTFGMHTELGLYIANLEIDLTAMKADGGQKYG